MFIHSVYFWLKDDLTNAQLEQYRAGLKALTTIGTVTFSYVGAPAGTPREVVDNSYSHVLIVGFADKAGHDAYQDDPIHDAFRNDCGTFWDRVQIYDAIGD